MECRPSDTERIVVMDSGPGAARRPGMTPAASVRPTVLAADRSWIALAPAPGIHCAEEIAERVVEQRGLLDVHRVAALRKDREAGRRDVLLQIDARLDAGVILVAADDQRRNGDLLDLLFELIDRRTVRLVAAHRVGGALRRIA